MNADTMLSEVVNNDILRAVNLLRFSGNAVFIARSPKERQELADQAVCLFNKGRGPARAAALDISALAGEPGKLKKALSDSRLPGIAQKPFAGFLDMAGFRLLERQPDISGFLNFILSADTAVKSACDKSVLIVGASSFLGNAVYDLFKREFSRVTGTGHAKAETFGFESLDVTSGEQVDGFFRAKPRFDVIIYAAGEADADKAEEQKERAWALNVEAVNLIAQSSGNCKFVYISSEYVFDGGNGPYSSLSAAEPVNYYGSTKLEGEAASLKNFPGALILRLGALYGHNGNFDKKTSVAALIDAIDGQRPIEADNAQIKRPVLLQDAAAALLKLLDLDESGIFQVNGPEGLTKEQMAGAIAEVRFELTGEAFAQSIAGLRTAGRAVKPLNTHMVNIDTPRPFKEGIRFLYAQLTGSQRMTS